MEFSIFQKDFLRLLRTISGAFASRTTASSHPILNNLLLTAGDGGVEVTAFDLTLCITLASSAWVEAPGQTTIPARELLNLVSRFPEEEIKVEQVSALVFLQTQGQRYSLPTQPATEFPSLPEPQEKLTPLPSSVLSQLGKVGFAARAETSPSSPLQGINFEWRENTIETAATDGTRLAMAWMEVERDSVWKDRGRIILPSRTFQEVGKALPSGGDPTLCGVEPPFVFFESDSTRISARILDGAFPGYRALVPIDFEHIWATDREELLDAVSRLTSFGATAAAIGFDPESLRIRLSSLSQNPGEGKETLLASPTQGDSPPNLQVNPRLLTDALKKFDSDQIQIKFNRSPEPVVLDPPQEQAKEDGGFSYLFMPCNIR